jgi:creatinine amidohydrolase
MRERMFREGIGAVTANGVLGDTRGMSAALGERLLEATADLAVESFGGRGG